jgi:hypothetical protein
LTLLTPLVKGGTHRGKYALIPQDYTVLKGLQEEGMTVRKHALPLRPTIGKNVERNPHRRGKLCHPVEQTLVIVPAEADEDIVITAARPIAAGHGAEQDDKCKRCAALGEHGVDKGYKLVNVRTIR